MATRIGRHALANRLRTGYLQPALPSVYLVGVPRDDPLGPMMAAALYLRGDGLVAGLAAARLWGLLDTTQQAQAHEPVDVLLVGRNADQPDGLRIRRARRLTRADVGWRNRIPVTSLARTVLDLAGMLDDLGLEAVASAAFQRRGLRRDQLEDVINRNPRARGVAHLRALSGRPRLLRDTRSHYERRLLKLIAAAELPAPLTNVKVAGQMVDMLWPELKLVLEFDGWSVHGGRRPFETDRLRDQRLSVTGHQVLRVTAHQLDQTPYALVARLAAVIAAIRFGKVRADPATARLHEAAPLDPGR